MKLDTIDHLWNSYVCTHIRESESVPEVRMWNRTALPMAKANYLFAGSHIKYGNHPAYDNDELY